MAETLPITARLIKAYRQLGWYTDDEQKEHKDEVVDYLYAASQQLTTLCFRDSFVSADYTHVYYPTGTILRLRNAPVTKISSITLNDTAIATSDYKLVDKLYIFYSTGFSVGDVLSITYTAGYNNDGWDDLTMADYDKWSVPLDIEQATIMLLKDIQSDSSDVSGLNRYKVKEVRQNSGGVINLILSQSPFLKSVIAKYKERD